MKTIHFIISAFVLLFFVGLGIKIYQAINSGTTTTTTTTYSDPNVAQNQNIPFRPQSVPIFEKEKDPPAKLPSDLKPKNVDRVIIITKKTNPKDTTIVFLDKKGNIRIPNQGGLVDEVKIYSYLDPILSWDWFIKIGVNGNQYKFSPMVGLSFLRILGKVDLPVFGVDIHGMGLGIDYQVADPFSLGVLYHSAWNTDKSIRLMLNYDF